jgi:hypothetical protein
VTVGAAQGALAPSGLPPEVPLDEGGIKLRHAWKEDLIAIPDHILPSMAILVDTLLDVAPVVATTVELFNGGALCKFFVL